MFSFVSWYFHPAHLLHIQVCRDLVCSLMISRRKVFKYCSVLDNSSECMVIPVFTHYNYERNIVYYIYML